VIFERIEDPGLSQNSFVVGCAQARRVAVVDPRRDVDVYLDYARDQGVEIAHVLETHIHADFASGARELAAATGAPLHLSTYDEGEAYDVEFPHHELASGDSVEIGHIRIEALHTPGHTPEHLAYLIYDGDRSKDIPQVMLSGDFLFVGSLGRPDLLGDEAKEALARRLRQSVREVLPELPAALEVHPGHGAGSMCGAGMSARPFSTLGFERVANPYLDPDLSEDAFVAKILGSAPPFPPYYRRMKSLNSAGPPFLEGLPGMRPIEPAAFRHLADQRHVVVDLRDQLAFGGGHVPGALGIGLRGNLSTWAAWVVPYETPILLVADSPDDVEPAVRALVRVGLDDVRGWLEGGIAAWREAGYPIETIPQIDVHELLERRSSGDSLAVLDVRTDGEWTSGHIEGAVHVMGGFLEERLDEVPRGDGLAVVCGSGYRSTVAASVLRRAGFDSVINVTGGMQAWRRAGLPESRS
jgi:hydroxyacylglutathione hydrolase